MPDVLWQTTRTRLGKLWKWVEASFRADRVAGFRLPPPAACVYDGGKSLLEHFGLFICWLKTF